MIRYDKRVAIALLIIFIIALLVNAFAITSFSIQDTNAATYVIVPMLMLPVFALFMLKRDIRPDVRPIDLAAGAALAAAFLVLIVLLRYDFSYLFISFRLDLLLTPLALAAMITLLFGLRNVGAFKALLVYSLISSPLVLMPIILQSFNFTIANSYVIFGFMKLFIPSATFLAPYSILAHGYDIGIGQTCVSIGAFIALALFLIPVAYLYEGSDRKKVFWVSSGVVLMLLFNLVRMFSITYYWFSNGPSHVAALIHTFIGAILFYIAVIVMLLIAGRYGLGFGRRKRPKRSAAPPKATPANFGAVLVLAAFVLAYFALSSDYGSAVYYQPTALAQRIPFNFSGPGMGAYVDRIANVPGYFTQTYSAANSPVAEIVVYNETITPENSILIYVSRPYRNITRSLLSNSTLRGERTYLSMQGVTERVYDLEAGGTDFFVYSVIVPYVLSNMSSTEIGVYVLQTNSTVGSGSQCHLYDPLYTALFNLGSSLSPNSAENERLDGAFCTAERIVWYNET